jgi:hypothetical protein
MYEEGKTKAIGDSKSSCGDRVNERWRLQRKGNVITDLPEHKVTSLSRCGPDIHSWAGWLASLLVSVPQNHKLTTWVRCKQASNSKLMNSKQFLSTIICLYILFTLFCHNLKHKTFLHEDNVCARKKFQI